MDRGARPENLSVTGAPTFHSDNQGSKCKGHYGRWGALRGGLKSGSDSL